MSEQLPTTIPALRTVAMPKDANANGDIFGGWVLSQMDIAGAVVAVRCAKGRIATVAIQAMQFHKPVFIGDVVTCFAKLVKTGTTSLTIDIETWAERRDTGRAERVTEGRFVYVAIDDNRNPRQLPKEK